jgi:predicted P-loop ATPase
MIKKPYGRNIERDNRRSIMVSSVNGDDFLRDASGNRRFQVISLPQKAQKQEFIPVELVARDRDRIWKAAILAYRAGEKPMLSLENQELSNQQNKGYLPEDMWSAKLDKWLSGVNEYGPDKEPNECFTTLDALKGVGFIGFEEKLGRREEMRMAALLQTKGFLKDDQQKTVNGVRGYYWHQSE